ncbi:hypothetical protein P691DRAFT_688641, partial [Macrolepiota fuliginosa MF-IS2]
LPDKFSDGKSTWCHTDAGKLLNRDGKEVCIIYNLGSQTEKTCSHNAKRLHICSYCGGYHAALSGDCCPLSS